MLILIVHLYDNETEHPECSNFLISFLNSQNPTF